MSDYRECRTVEMSDYRECRTVEMSDYRECRTVEMLDYRECRTVEMSDYRGFLVYCEIPTHIVMQNGDKGRFIFEKRQFCN